MEHGHPSGRPGAVRPRQHAATATLLGLDTLLEVEGPDGTVLVSDDDGAGSFASRVTFTVPATGSYRARVSSFPGTTGTYQISARR